METIKIGRRTYDIKEGDYFLYNGGSVLFCSGDNRVLKQEGFDSYRYLAIPASVQSKFKEEIKPLKEQYKKKKRSYCYYFKTVTK
jgi:hypothetical protein